MDELIHNFSIKALTDFFRRSVTAFRPQTENLSDYIENKHFDQFTELTRIGNLTFDNAEELIVFACQYNGNLSERSSKKQQFKIAKNVLQQDLKDAAISVFYDKRGTFRLSFIRRNWDKSQPDQKYSSYKRFTYLVTPNEANKTFRERIENCTFADLDSIQEAFSVEKLTNEFYNDLKRWYDRTLLSETGISFPADSTEQREETIIRLITRLLFVWFIKQKNLIPNHLFETEKIKEILKDFDPNSSTDGNYYNAVLQNLFFATLNKSVTEREFAKGQNREIKTRYRYAEMFSLSENEILQLFAKIPFLNGGLFECLDREEKTHGEKYHLDGFSRNKEKTKNGTFKHRAFIPNAVFFNENAKYMTKTATN